MVVGVCRMTLGLPGNDSLKGKRKVVRGLLDRMRSKFNVAAAEVEDMDNHRRAVVGFSVVSNDAAHANSMLDTIAEFIVGARGALVTGQSLELIHLADGAPLGRDEAGW